MKKISLLFFLFVSTLFAENATQEQLNSIYQEALLFIAIFGTMGIISYIYSTKHAKEYVPKERTQAELDMEALKENRVQKLSKLLNENRLTEEEFDILRQYYK